MVGIILASHGHFAEGIKESAQMIFGEQEKFESAILLPSMGPDDLRSDLEAAIKKIDCDEILFLVDLWGG
ncbi:MAG: PTS mannose transporter subunit EIIAB, partial [Anaerococcus sp.]|nr:PTS mannose transporter subunit EIIAB [Anaerococcus sp.]